MTAESRSYSETQNRWRHPSTKHWRTCTPRGGSKSDKMLRARRWALQSLYKTGRLLLGVQGAGRNKWRDARLRRWCQFLRGCNLSPLCEAATTPAPANGTSHTAPVPDSTLGPFKSTAGAGGALGAGAADTSFDAKADASTAHAKITHNKGNAWITVKDILPETTEGR